MSAILTVVQHHPVEGVGDIGAWARMRGLELQVHRADLGELPSDIDGPCVFLGGPYSVCDPPDWLQQEKAWLRTAMAGRMPVLGICLGSQLLADALGGRVHTLERPETGWTRIAFDDGSELDALQWHEDTFTPPPGCKTLAHSATCAMQMFRSGNRIGIQFHPEWNASLVAALNDHFGAESSLPREHDVERHARVSEWFHRLLDEWRSSW